MSQSPWIQDVSFVKDLYLHIYFEIERNYVVWCILEDKPRKLLPSLYTPLMTAARSFSLCLFSNILLGSQYQKAIWLTPPDREHLSNEDFRGWRRYQHKEGWYPVVRANQSSKAKGKRSGIFQGARWCSVPRIHWEILHREGDLFRRRSWYSIRPAEAQRRDGYCRKFGVKPISFAGFPVLWSTPWQRYVLLLGTHSSFSSHSQDTLPFWNLLCCLCFLPQQSSLSALDSLRTEDWKISP